MKVQYDLEDILSILICAEVYEFGDDILYASLIKPLNITNSHIEKYIENTYKVDKYTEEEIGIYKEVLLELFKIYK